MLRPSYADDRADFIAEPRPLWGGVEPTLLDWRPEVQPSPRQRHAIQLPDEPGQALCPRCGRRFLAAGPTGHLDDQPLCDLCLLDLAPELGMVLALVAVTRAFAGLEPPDEAAAEDALHGLVAFARVYHRFAGRSGPPRPFPIDGDPLDDPGR